MQYFRNFQRRFRSLVFTACLATSATISLAATPPTTQPLTPVAAEWTAIQTNLQLQRKQVSETLKAPGLWSDASKRANALQQVQPILQAEVKQLDRLAAIDPAYVAARNAHCRVITVTLAALDEPASTASIESEINSQDPAVSISGQVDQLTVKWILGEKDAAKQRPVATAIEKLDRQFQTSDELTRASYSFAMQAATPQLKSELQAAAVGMTSRQSERLRTMGESATELAAKSASVLASLVNKPLTLAGTTSDGKPFTTAGWKGKVILVDFWATWCAPCKAELPQVKEMYSSYHDKGLEVLGVSNDFQKSALLSFIAKDHLPWPELFDASAAAEYEWNAITEKMGIPSIPMIFIIDKKGICRTTEGQSQMDKLIPQLLAEPPDTSIPVNVPR